MGLTLLLDQINRSVQINKGPIEGWGFRKNFKHPPDLTRGATY